MNYIISLFICVITVNAIYAQNTDSIKLTSNQKAEHLSKSRLQNRPAL